MLPRKQTRVTVVDGVVGGVPYTDQVLKTQSKFTALDDVSRNKRVHVVDNNLVVNLVTFYTQIATKVTRDGVPSKTTPGHRGVEILVDPSFEAEGRFADVPAECEILVAAQKRVEL